MAALERGRRAGRLDRRRLTDVLAGAHRCALFAPSGYGKSTLVDDLADRLGWATVFVELSDLVVGDQPSLTAAIRRGLRSAGLRLMAESLGADSDDAGAAALRSLPQLLADRDEPLLLVVDDAHVLTSDAAAALTEFLAALPARHHVVVCGQDEPVWRSAPNFDVALTADQLAFTADEAAELAYRRGIALTDEEAARLVDATRGWPAVLTLAVAAQVPDARGGRGLSELVSLLLARLDPSLRDDVLAIAQLPLLSDAVCSAAARPGALAALAATGIPLRQRADGWFVVPDPVRAALEDPSALWLGAAVSAAGAYLDAGEAGTACAVLRSRLAFEELCALLESRPWQDLQALDTSELQSLIAGLPDELLDDHPRLLLSVARVAESAARTEWRAELVARAARAADVVAGSALKREIGAEAANDLSYDGDIEGTTRLCDEVLSAARDEEIVTRARALMALGRAQAFARDAPSMVAAAETLTEAASLLRLVNEPEWLAHVLLRLGYSVHYAEGDLEAALARTREAVDAAPRGARERATVLTFLADILAYAGQLDEAEAVLRSMADVARRLRDQRLLGYHAWVRASIASRRGDAEGVTRSVTEALRHPGDWYEHPTGIEFLADVVELYGRVGEFDRAAEFLVKVEARCAVDRHEGVDQIALSARATYGARAGDPAAAETDLVALLQTEQLPPRETWHVSLLRGLAALRRGDKAAAGSFAARAFEEAAAMGHPELPRMHEPEAYAQLLPLARRTGSGAVETVQSAEPSLAVRVLGDFVVSASGRPTPPPPGRPQMLVKLLAINGGPVAVDEAVEILWPEIDPDTGRARLRNVLSRIKAACGELVQRDGDALVLGSDVTVDAVEFDREARVALSGAPDQTNEIARRAIARYAGEVLPSDRYEDFTVAPRERLALRYLALLDRLAVDAERNEDIDEALRLYGEAISAAPLDEHRYEKAAALAMRSGRRQRAVELFDHARRALAELGVEPSQELARIVGRG